MYSVAAPSELNPKTSVSADKRWIYPIMDEVIKGIDAGDLACIALGVDFIEEDDSFAFGRILKSNTARSLRRSEHITEPHKERIRERVISMLITGETPREMKEYIKLLRVVGVDEVSWQRLQQGVPRDDRYAMRLYQGLRMATGLPIER